MSRVPADMPGTAPGQHSRDCRDRQRSTISWMSPVNSLVADTVSMVASGSSADDLVRCAPMWVSVNLARRRAHFQRISGRLGPTYGKAAPAGGRYLGRIPRGACKRNFEGVDSPVCTD